MTNDTKTPAGDTTNSAAQRMRLYRMRKRFGLHCLTIELPEKHIVALIRRGLLRQQDRNDPDAVIHSLYVLLARSLE